MSKPTETEAQRACREWWNARLAEQSMTVAWGRDKNGILLSEFARNAELAWMAASTTEVRRLSDLTGAAHGYKQELEASNAELDQLRRQLAEAEAEIARLRGLPEFVEALDRAEAAEAAEAKLALAEQDARRYRWLRDNSNTVNDHIQRMWAECRTNYPSPAEWDTAIDAAIAAGEGSRE